MPLCSLCLCGLILNFPVYLIHDSQFTILKKFTASRLYLLINLPLQSSLFAYYAKSSRTPLLYLFTMS
jgi:hypothetical protein